MNKEEIKKRIKKNSFDLIDDLDILSLEKDIEQ
jgi:hypothetical protein